MKRNMHYQPPKKVNKQLDRQMTIEVDNQKLNRLLADYQANTTTENLNSLLNHMITCRILVPANLNENRQPVPCLIKNKDDTRFLPIYTDKGQIPTHLKSQAVLNVPYLAMNRTALKGKELSGIVVNPFSNNLVFKPVLLEKIAEAEEKKEKIALTTPQKTVKLTEQQYLQLERHQFEASFLPKQLYAEGQAFMDTLMDEKEEYIDRLFEESFKEKRMYPYLPEDFSVMTMNISDTFSVVRIDMPERDPAVGLAQRIYCTWDADNRKAGCYLICIGKEKGELMLVEVTSELKAVTHGTAPAVGAELQAVIDLAQAQPELTS